MEVGDQAVQQLEFVARIDEDIGPAAPGPQVPVFICRGLDGPAAGGPHADDTAALLLCPVDLLSLALLYLIEFRVHMVLQDIVHLHRPEGAKSHMKGDAGNVHSLALYLLQKLRRKVQSCRGGCRRPAVLCVDCLVAVLVLQLVSDIGRQGHLSQLVQYLLKDAVVGKPHKTVALLHHINDLSYQKTLPKADPGTRLRLFPRLHQRLPDIILFPFQQ